MGNVVNKTLETTADEAVAGKEPSLGNPTTNGMVLSSTATGERSWIVSGGLSHFTEARTITAPNATKPVHSIKATGAETNIDIAIVPKGAGALTTQIADGTATGGNKRGSSAVDLQLYRTAANQVASETSSGILSGEQNKASGVASVVCGGKLNTASGANSFVGSGESNTASWAYSGVGSGYSNTASGMYSFVSGGAAGVASAIYGVVIGNNRAQAYLVGQAVCGGDNIFTKVRQDSKLSAQKNTTDASVREMFLDYSTSRAVLKNNCAWAFDITILAHSSTNVLHTARFKRSGLILRGTSAATTTLEGAVQTIGTDIINSNLAGCDVVISADTTNGSLKVEVTGIASTTIVWQAKIELVEIEI